MGGVSAVARIVERGRSAFDTDFALALPRITSSAEGRTAYDSIPWREISQLRKAAPPPSPDPSLRRDRAWPTQPPSKRPPLDNCERVMSCGLASAGFVAAVTWNGTVDAFEIEPMRRQSWCVLPEARASTGTPSGHAAYTDLRIPRPQASRMRKGSHRPPSSALGADAGDVAGRTTPLPVRSCEHV